MKKILLLVSVMFILLLLSLIRAPVIAYFAFVPEQILTVPQQDVFGAENVTLVTVDGIKLHGLYFSALEPAEMSNKVVLYLHGNAGHLFDRVDAANELRLQGINVLLIDYRGFGLSEGNISEGGFYLDAQAALIWLTENRDFDVRSVIVLGRSIGSVAALKLAVDNDVAAVILISPIASASAMADEMGMSWLSPLAYGALDNVQRASHLNRPLLIVHGDQDQMVPIRQGQAIFNATNLPSDQKQFIIVDKANHHNIRQTVGDEYWPWLMSFIRQKAI